MDSTVIEEIAKQLGMAVDQTGMFITEQLPQYAALKAMQCGSLIVGCALILLLSGIMLFVSIKRGWSEDIVWIFGLVTLFFAVFFVGALLLFGTSLMGWVNYPEAMLIDMAMKAVA